MRPVDNIDKFIKKLHLKAGADLDRRVHGDISTALAESEKTESAIPQPAIRRTIMKNPVARLTCAATAVVVVVLSIALWERFSSPAYALSQTVEALKNVRFIHLVQRDAAGPIRDERWIEVGMDGRQVRYWQGKSGDPFAIEDGESTAVYLDDQKTVVIYDRKDKQFQWVGPLGVFFENLRQKGKIIKQNDNYHGRPAHRVWWPMAGAECFVDPKTKLPMAIGTTQMSYEQPPEGTFEIIIPQDFAVVDMRPGRETEPIPEWLQEMEIADQRFNQATHALARGDCAEAAELLEYVVEHQSSRNWAWFWLGSAYYKQGEYQLAIEKFNRVFEMYGDNPCHFCNYARGLAYAQSGMHEPAQQDLQICLPWMISALQEPSAAALFEYADNPLLRYGKDRPSEQQVVINMINRLRIVTGQNFGYDPNATEQDNEGAIAAWEQWFENDGRINFTPDAQLIGVSPGSDVGG